MFFGDSDDDDDNFDEFDDFRVEKVYVTAAEERARNRHLALGPELPLAQTYTRSKRQYDSSDDDDDDSDDDNSDDDSSDDEGSAATQSAAYDQPASAQYHQKRSTRVHNLGYNTMILYNVLPGPEFSVEYVRYYLRDFSSGLKVKFSFKTFGSQTSFQGVIAVTFVSDAEVREAIGLCNEPAARNIWNPCRPNSVIISHIAEVTDDILYRYFPKGARSSKSISKYPKKKKKKEEPPKITMQELQLIYTTRQEDEARNAAQSRAADEAHDSQAAAAYSSQYLSNEPRFYFYEWISILDQLQENERNLETYRKLLLLKTPGADLQLLSYEYIAEAHAIPTAWIHQKIESLKEYQDSIEARALAKYAE